jgi:hypothetical protein
MPPGGESPGFIREKTFRDDERGSRMITRLTGDSMDSSDIPE